MRGCGTPWGPGCPPAPLVRRRHGRSLPLTSAESGRDRHPTRPVRSVSAGHRDVRIAGGGATILEYVNAGLVDGFSIALSPVLFGSGVRLFEGVDAGRVALEPIRTEHSPRVTHLTYAVRQREADGGRETSLTGTGG
ncbi:dihydrofolate reductase family protein [Actinomadura sp. NPDC049753]|uniref:dihydrofolate reductase family protein n=1 Tax=Actinomadura sp. NPDC049753 TaxID=3154739 RepID=UPI003421C4CC